jgi:hypothetical protein
MSRFEALDVYRINDKTYVAEWLSMNDWLVTVWNSKGAEQIVIRDASSQSEAIQRSAGIMRTKRQQAEL